ncbi:MAG: hypothetical protein OH335_04720 [Candidatus Parvarchaeota archaeon]|nr:hypothetical protein [Candidatus Jingweiarchaeum tengchongense]MCW1306049.1 hypothetical protein [Candidatus Jingweiarchaeum tengchongense]
MVKIRSIETDVGAFYKLRNCLRAGRKNAIYLERNCIKDGKKVDDSLSFKFQFDIFDKSFKK